MSAVAELDIRPAQECAYDIVSLGEVMLRLDPGAGRIRTAREFAAWEGGGEYNVARGLSRAFGMRAGVVTALVDNEVGRLVEGLILAGGVDARRIVWFTFDGLGRAARNGLNFTERGFGLRGAVGVSDRGHTAISQLAPEQVDWDELFGEAGSRWLHTGGIFAGLSETSAQTTLAAVKAARRHGVKVSYDLNYRPSLWKSRGGTGAAQEVNREIAQYVDVMIGNEEDFTACLGFEVEGAAGGDFKGPADSYAEMILRVVEQYPGISVVGTTLRHVNSASDNDWQALAWSRETGVVLSRKWEHMEVLDRVGGGDSFASGLVYGLMTDRSLEEAVNIGAAHGALAVTTPGDTSMASLNDVLKLAGGGGARVDR